MMMMTLLLCAVQSGSTAAADSLHKPPPERSIRTGVRDVYYFNARSWKVYSEPTGDGEPWSAVSQYELCHRERNHSSYSVTLNESLVDLVDPQSCRAPRELVQVNSRAYKTYTSAGFTGRLPCAAYSDSLASLPSDDVHVCWVLIQNGQAINLDYQEVDDDNNTFVTSRLVLNSTSKTLYILNAQPRNQTVNDHGSTQCHVFVKQAAGGRDVEYVSRVDHWVQDCSHGYGDIYTMDPCAWGGNCQLVPVPHLANGSWHSANNTSNATAPDPAALPVQIDCRCSKGFSGAFCEVDMREFLTGWPVISGIPVYEMQFFLPILLYWVLLVLGYWCVLQRSKSTVNNEQSLFGYDPDLAGNSMREKSIYAQAKVVKKSK